MGLYSCINSDSGKNLKASKSVVNKGNKSLLAGGVKRPRVVYLDQSVWSNLGKYRANTLPVDTLDFWGNALDKLTSLVRAEAIVCPISFAHTMELANFHRKPAVQRKMIQVMVELSRGLCLPFIVIGETAGLKPAMCTAAAMYPREGLDTLLGYQLRCAPARVALEFVLNGMTTPSKLPSQVESFIRDITSKLRLKAGDELVGTFAAPDANVDLRWLKEIIRLLLMDPGRVIKHGDSMDVMHLLFASAADFALADKATVKMVENNALLRFRIFYKVEELLAQLQQLAV